MSTRARKKKSSKAVSAGSTAPAAEKPTSDAAVGKRSDGPAEKSSGATGGKRSDTPAEKRPEVTVEKHWGDPTRSQVREDTSRSERVAGMVWICFGAAVSCILEILYARITLTLGGHTYIVPGSIIAAGIFNWILGRTALLWRRTMGYALVPLMVWGAVLIVAIAWPYIPGLRGTQWVYSDIWTALLLLAGAVGGMIPTMQALAVPSEQEKAA